MYFDRRVRYLDYMENGEKVKGVGFVKAEVRDDICRMQVCVSGLHATDHFEKQVILAADKQESFLCRIRIEGGKGSTGELKLDSERMGRGELPYRELREIRIPVAAGKEIRCIWQESKREGVFPEKSVYNREDVTQEKGIYDREEVTREKREDSREDVIQEERASDRGKVTQVKRASGREEVTQEKRVSDREILSGKESKNHEEAVLEEMWGAEKESALGEKIKNVREAPSEERMNLEKTTVPENHAGTVDIVTQEERRTDVDDLMGDVSPHAEETAETVAQKENAHYQQFPLDDKWSQLAAIYPHIAPFEDEREYLSLGPGDFVIFPSQYYRVVNNSFLLHGFHNYQHLILSRMEVRGEIRYYVGVPGNFYDKEKQVAMMFGFESFECKEEPARSGDYGYYMMRVEL